MKNIVIIFIFGLSFYVKDGAAETGKTSASFLKVGVGPRALAMGGANCAVANDLTVLYWNSAILSELVDKEIYASHNELGQGIRQGFLGYIYPGRVGAIGLGVNYLYLGGIEVRSNPTDQYECLIEASDLMVIVGYGRRITPNFSLGGNCKLIYEKLETEEANTGVFDLGALYKKGERTRFGLNLQNLGGKIKFIKEEYNLPLNIKAGVAFLPWEDQLTLTVDVDKFIYDDRFKLHAGAEYWLVDTVALRGGCSFDSHDKDWKPSFGVGFNTSNFKVDYAFLPIEDIGGTHRISILTRFGKILQIEDLSLQNLLPSRYKYYIKEPIGKVKIRNTSFESLRRVRVSLFIPEYMSFPVEHEILEIKPNSTEEVFLKAIFNNKIFYIDEDTPVQAQIKVGYYAKGEKIENSVTESLTIFNRNIIDWRESENIASFVTPNDPMIKEFTRKVTGLWKERR